MSSKKLVDEIAKLKGERDAVILAHNYQRPEVQDIADFVGDSLGLAREAKEADAECILFCGVDFMAETAKILNPNKTVLMPDLGARCPMAAMLRKEDLEKALEENRDARVVLYINTLAEAKVYADSVCTSANAAKIVNAMDTKRVIFGPDKNLLYYVSKRSNKTLFPVPADGLCPTHHHITGSDLAKAKKEHPGALVVVHPECTPDIQEAADHIASTEGMAKFCKASTANNFIIGTEIGMLHRLKREMPKKRFYPISEKAVCPNMKVSNLENVRDALKKMAPVVEVPPGVVRGALRSITRMFEIDVA